MGLPEQRTRILAGTPVVIGEQRLLPSVLVNTFHMDQANRGKLRVVRLRPISVVVTSPQDSKWLEIPNTTMDTLSIMAGVGAAIALVSLFIIVIVRLFKRL
jgi:hypothetical protein